MCHYTKTTCSIFFKLTLFNKVTLRLLNVNFLRDQSSFKVTMNFNNND